MGRGRRGGTKSLTQFDILLKMVLDFPDQLTLRSFYCNPLSPCLDQGGVTGMELTAAHIHHRDRDFCFDPEKKTSFVLSYKGRQAVSND